MDIASSDSTTTTYTVAGLTQGTGYEFQVRAIDSDRAEGDRAGGTARSPVPLPGLKPRRPR